MIKQALILCGGKGTRFRSVSQSPKILAKINNRFFIDLLIEYLWNQGITSFIFATGYKSEEIVQHLKRYDELDYVISHEINELGTGGAVINAYKYLNNERILVVNGDTYFAEQLPSSLIDPHASSLVCGVRKIEQNDRYGTVSINGGKIRFERGSPDNFIQNSFVFCGIISFHKKMLPYSYVKDDIDPISLEELAVEMSNTHEVLFSEFKHDFIDYGIPKDYHRLLKLISSEKKC